jgi:hypothetical protein
VRGAAGNAPALIRRGSDAFFEPLSYPDASAVILSRSRASPDTERPILAPVLAPLGIHFPHNKSALADNADNGDLR